jgi:hypothetical protein
MHPPKANNPASGPDPREHDHALTLRTALRKIDIEV